MFLRHNITIKFPQYKKNTVGRIAIIELPWKCREWKILIGKKVTENESWEGCCDVLIDMIARLENNFPDA